MDAWLQGGSRRFQVLSHWSQEEGKMVAVPDMPERSKCCAAPMSVEGRTTLHYKCSRCGNPADLIDQFDVRLLREAKSDPRTLCILSSNESHVEGLEVYLNRGWVFSQTGEHSAAPASPLVALYMVLTATRCTCDRCNSCSCDSRAHNHR